MESLEQAVIVDVSIARVITGKPFLLTFGFNLSNQFKEGKPCYKGGSNVCNQNGAFGRNAKLICKKTGNVM